MSDLAGAINSVIGSGFKIQRHCSSRDCAWRLKEMTKLAFLFESYGFVNNL